MNATSPKISIICICFNHERYVIESLQSVLSQTYKNYEVILIDDGSTDGSIHVIEDFLKDHPEITFIRLEKNEGICKAFNTGFKICSGDLIVDLAADDVLVADHLERGVKIFNMLDDTYGVIFGDAEWIDAQGKRLCLHSEKYPHNTIPEGNIYQDLIERYFICSPTMIFRRAVVQRLGGYDETLTYEDFDFWIRSSRIFKYYYHKDVVVKKRKLKNSLSQNQFKILNKHNYSTFLVCRKIRTLNRTKAEKAAFKTRLQYEIRQCMRTLDFTLALKYVALWINNKGD